VHTAALLATFELPLVVDVAKTPHPPECGNRFASSGYGN
jgi:hypothetical protein